MDIVYFINDEEKVLKVEARPLTTELRIRISNHDVKAQKDYKKFAKSNLNSTVAAKDIAISNEIEKMIAAQLASNPELSAEELQNLRESYYSTAATFYDDEDIEERERLRLAHINFFTHKQFDLFKLLLRKNKLSEEEQVCIDSDYDSEFWTNIDERGVKLFNSKFRG